MKKITNWIDGLHFDNKLVTTLASAVVTWGLAKYAAELDPTIAAALAALVAGGIGYRTPNEATVLRQEQESGNPDPDLVYEKLGHE